MTEILLRAAAALLLAFALGACDSGGDDDDDNGNGNGGLGTAGVTIGGNPGTTGEDGSSTTLTVVLDQEPGADVLVAVSSADPGEIEVTAGGALTFTPANWNQPQTVTLTGQDDEIPDGDVVVQITASAGNTGGFSGESDTVNVTNLDDNREFAAAMDNTLYEDGMNPATTSNGAGQHLFTGRVGVMGNFYLRRALIAFDLSAIPDTATITGATLRLNYSKGQNANATEIGLHRLRVGWGEEDSDAPLNEGEGATAQVGDATWTHRASGSSAWTAPGASAPNDYDANASATATLTNTGSYDWTGGTLATDVQQWVNGTNQNHGWILILTDEGVNSSAKRLDSREHPDFGSRPVLLVDY